MAGKTHSRLEAGATRAVIRVRRKGKGFVYESPSFYVWEEDLSDLLREVHEQIGLGDSEDDRAAIGARDRKARRPTV